MPAFDWLSQEDLISRVLYRLKQTRTPQPAFTLLLGSGFSYPLIPTAGQVVARDVAWWLYWRTHASETDPFADRPTDDTEVRAFEKGLWPKVHKQCDKSFRLKDDLPETDAANVGMAYQAIMSGKATSGLSDPQERRRYLRGLVARVGKKVNGAHIFLASILRAQAQEGWPENGLRRPFCRTLFTTNFDPLLQRSLQLVSNLYFMSDRPEALEPPEDEDQDAIHLVYSHGSVHRYLLLNTQQEIANASKRNYSKLVPYFQRHGVLVVGYSGWQDATMKALAKCQSFDGNLYWCDVYGPEEAEERLSPAARALLKKRRGDAFYVSIAGADQLMLALHRELGLEDAPGFIRDPIFQMIEDLQSVLVTDASSEPDALETFKESREQILIRLRAAERFFKNPEQLQAGGPATVSADDQRIYGEALTAKMMDEALTKWRAGFLHQAIRLWTKIIKDKRSAEAFIARALVNRGVAHGQRDQPAAEIADYTAAIAIPDASADTRARALVYRGITYEQQGRLEQAIADYAAVIAMTDAPAEQRAAALVYQGINHEQRGRLEQAVADYTAVIAMPDAPAEQRAAALVYRGVIHVEHGRPDQAIADCNAVIDMPDAPAEHKSLALANRGWGRFTKQPSDIAGLREDSEAALVISPELIVARFNLGFALLLKGESGRAFREYAQAAKEATGVADIRSPREDLERATADKGVASGKKILAVLRAREAELAARPET
jgi:tetratricopeptide (TPR) repeat protein